KCGTPTSQVGAKKRGSNGSPMLRVHPDRYAASVPATAAVTATSFASTNLPPSQRLKPGLPTRVHSNPKPSDETLQVCRNLGERLNGAFHFLGRRVHLFRRGTYLFGGGSRLF